MFHKTSSSLRTMALLFTFFITQLLIEAKSFGVPFIQPFSFPNDVIKGQSVTITCAVTAGTGTFTFKWSKDGQSLSDQPFSRIQTFEEYSLLYLKSVDSSKSGNYTCFVTNAAGSANHTVELIVYEFPEWNIVPEDKEVLYGSDVSIDCSGYGLPLPKATWKKVQSTEASSFLNKGHNRLLSNGTLVLVDVQIEDGGEYECSISNGIGEDLKKTVSVKINVPPQFHEAVQLQNVRSGHSVVLRCDVVGDTPISVHWTKEYMDHKDSRYKIQETPLPNGLLSELFISRIMREDAGLYICTATNNYGKEQKTIKLTVLVFCGEGRTDQYQSPM